MKKWIIGVIAILCVASCNEKDLFFEPETAAKKEKPILYFTVDVENGTPQTKGTIVRNKKWENGSAIIVKFLDGSDKAKEVVKEAAREWENYANINFVFLDNATNPHVKLKFGGRPVSWSRIGTDHKLPSSPTTSTAEFCDNFENWAKSAINKKKAKADALRVFGHILGMVMEHQSPVGGLLLNYSEEEIIEHLMGEYGLSQSEAQAAINFYNKTESNYTEYDPNSVMVCPTIFNDGLLIDRDENEISYGIKSELSDLDKKFIAHEYPKKYHNGYQHNLNEPDWEKLRTITGVIGAQRDIYGNFYFYPYSSGGNILKYNSELEFEGVIGKSIGSQYRLAPVVLPTDNGDILIRKGYMGGDTFPDMYRISAVDLNNPSNEYFLEKEVVEKFYGGLKVDYYNNMVYLHNKIYDNELNEVGSFVGSSGYSSEEVLYVGRRYKWIATSPMANWHELVTKPITIYIYDNAEKDIMDASNLVTSFDVPGFIMYNGGHANIYEYNDKLVIVRFGGSRYNGSNDFGSIVIISPTGNYKQYNYSNAITKPSSPYHLCGGFYWKSKLFAYDEHYGQYYFEFPELDDPNF